MKTKLSSRCRTCYAQFYWQLLNNCILRSGEAKLRPMEHKLWGQAPSTILCTVWPQETQTQLPETWKCKDITFLPTVGVSTDNSWWSPVCKLTDSGDTVLQLKTAPNTLCIIMQGWVSQSVSRQWSNTCPQRGLFEVFPGSSVKPSSLGS